MQDLYERYTDRDFVRRQDPGSLLQSIRHCGMVFTVEPIDEILISMTLLASFSMTLRMDQSVAEIVPTIGCFGILTPGHPVGLDIRGRCSVLQVKLPVGLFSDWIAEDHGLDAASIEVRPGHSIVDPIVAQLACSAMSAGVDGERELVRALATRLLQKYSSLSKTIAPSPRGGLTTIQLRRVTDCVGDRLPGKVTLDVMASAAGLSPFHFTREFKRSTGRTPHQYVMIQRLSRAVIDVEVGRQSVAEVAKKNGFSHASHFSQEVKKTLGCTPGQLRRFLL